MLCYRVISISLYPQTVPTMSPTVNYKSIVDMMGRMAREEGVMSPWRGSSLTVNRAMIVTTSQMATYDQAKEAILRSQRAGNARRGWLRCGAGGCDGVEHGGCGKDEGWTRAC